MSRPEHLLYSLMFTFMLGAVISTTATTQALVQLVCRDRGIAQAACRKQGFSADEWDAIVASATGWSEWVLVAKTLPAALVACSGGFLSDRVGRRWLLLAPVLGDEAALRKRPPAPWSLAAAARPPSGQCCARRPRRTADPSRQKP